MHCQQQKMCQNAEPLGVAAAALIQRWTELKNLEEGQTSQQTLHQNSMIQSLGWCCPDDKTEYDGELGQKAPSTTGCVITL